MKKLLLHVLALPVIAYAQTTPPPPPTVADPAPVAPKVSVWKTDVQTGLNINQATYSDNWKAGGVSSVAVSTFLNAKLVRKVELSEWTNDLQLLYGTVANEGQSIRKNADRIFFDSKYAKKLSNKWNAFASVNFMSQFDAGFSYTKVKDVEQSKRISGFLAPGYFTEALGFEWKPVNYFSAQFGLGAMRQTVVTDQTLYDKYDSTAKEYSELYGVKRGDKVRNQAIFQVVLNYDKEVMKNVVLKWRYLGLLDYERLQSQYIVSRVDVSISAKVNKYISTNLSAVLLYDYDQDKDLQFSQVLSLGILYNFSNHSTK